MLIAGLNDACGYVAFSFAQMKRNETKRQGDVERWPLTIARIQRITESKNCIIFIASCKIFSLNVIYYPPYLLLHIFCHSIYACSFANVHGKVNVNDAKQKLQANNKEECFKSRKVRKKNSEQQMLQASRVFDDLVFGFVYFTQQNQMHTTI